MNTVRIIPLGGVGEIGLNMMVMEAEDESIVIDCGLMFPEPHMPGIDIVIPDFEYIKDSGKKLGGIVLTHGHEDHIGALPFFLREIKAPVFGTSLTLGILKNKLIEHDLADKVELIEMEAGGIAKIGPFSIEFISVCHSIPDGCALAIETPAGTIVHSGDFKFDDTPVDSRMTDYSRLAYYGNKGVLALLSDSTNAETPGRTDSESGLYETFEKTFRESKGKVFVSLFSSNINRIQQIIRAAEKCGRKIVLVGRSLVSNIRISTERGYIKTQKETIINVTDIKNYSPGELAVITTGSQGEPMSGLSLMATSSHKHVSVNEGDRVILSSKSIPGNEKLICNIINQLIGIGADVMYDKIADVHVSGHGYRDELKTMMALTKPEYFVPIHGEKKQLVQHIKLARGMGIAEEKTLLAENGRVIVADDSGVRLDERIKSGRVFVDGKGVGDVKDLVLRDRVNLSRDGMVVTVVTVAPSDGAINSTVELFSRGFIQEEDQDAILDEAKGKIAEFLAGAGRALKTDWAEMEAETGKILKRFFKKKTGRRPVIIPVIIEL